MTDPSQSIAEPPPDAAAEAQQAFQSWQAGDQTGAIGRVQVRADRGEFWAIALLTFMYIQQGPAGLRLALPYAERALAIGMPWVTSTLLNNMIGQVPSDPGLLDELMRIASPGPLLAVGFDPMGNGWNLLAQGQAGPAVRLLSMTVFLPPNVEGWQQLVEQARGRLRDIEQSLAAARNATSEVQTISQDGIDEIEQRRQALLTAANQANVLLSSVNAGAVNSLFKEDATRREGESKTSWRWGISVLIAAAAVAVFPLILHYVGAGPRFSSAGLLTAHTASTVALATIAGVLLSRARGRDRAAQRSSDLSTAMGTMITYSNQISDEVDKQKFMLTMGQLVLQAHLQSEAGTKEESMTGLVSLVNAIRGPGSS